MQTRNHPIQPIVWATTCAVLIGSGASASYDYGVAGELYTQDFNTLVSTGDANSWTNNSTLEGWYLYSSQSTSGASGRVTTRPDNVAPGDWVAPTTYRAADAMPIRSNFWSVGAAGSSERAIGSYTTANGNPFADQPYAGDNMYALVIHNTTSSALSDLTVSYTGEQWQGNFNGDVADSIVFSYLIKAGFDAQADIPTQNTYDPYTLVGALDFVGNAMFAPDQPLDGNDAANRTQLSHTLENVTLQAGEYLILRWLDNDASGEDLGLAIDDVSFTANAVPEPAAGIMVLCGLTLLANRRRS